MLLPSTKFPSLLTIGGSAKKIIAVFKYSWLLSKIFIIRIWGLKSVKNDSSSSISLELESATGEYLMKWILQEKISSFSW